MSGTNSFTGGTANLTGNYTCVGNTLLNIAGGTVNFDGSGTVSPTRYLNLNGILGGAQYRDGGQAMNWTGGTMDGSGRTIIRAGSHAEHCSRFHRLWRRFSCMPAPWRIAGTVVWGGGNLGMSVVSSPMTPGRPFRSSTPAHASFNTAGGSPRFDNAGTFTTPGIGTTAFSGVALNNFNTVGIPGGVLYAGGGYVCSSNSILNCALWGTVPGAAFGQLQASGTVNVQGSLKVYLTNYYVPKTNDSFAVLTAPHGHRRILPVLTIHRTISPCH